MKTFLEMSDCSPPPREKKEILPLVIQDMRLRGEKGLETYGRPLTTFNGRSALQDAYEEALDLAMYLKQAIMEKSS